VVGESGSGKTVISQAILGILPANARITGGSIWFNDPLRNQGVLDLAVTLFPHPLSPTTPNVTPGYKSKLTPSTAFTNPSSCGKYVFRFRTDSNASRDEEAEEPATSSPIMCTDRRRPAVHRPGS